MASDGWEVYIVRAESGVLYTGISTDVERRFAEHSGGARRAKFFRLSSPADLVYRERCADRGAAQRRELEIKRLSRLQKLALIAAARAVSDGG